MDGMKYMCIENKCGNTNFVIGKRYKILTRNRIECETLFLNLGDLKLTDEIEFAMCKFRVCGDY